MKNLISYIFCIVTLCEVSAQTQVIEIQTKQPVSYATISFGNGSGTFADDDGVFVFTKKLYTDVDSLYISALGYKDVIIPTLNLPKTILMETQTNVLDEILISVTLDRKFKEETLKPYLDDDYYKCWLPTIESEIGVFFPNKDDKLKKITVIHFPVTLESRDWEQRKRKNADKKSFSTLFKVKFYKNDNGFPGDVMTYDNIVFRATEKKGDVIDLDVSSHDLFIPKNGFFVSLQVLGYTDKAGKLLPNKKYKEIKTKEGVVKIPTNFRPLLPFTDKISEHNTFIKRIFLNHNAWVPFKKGLVDSSLLKSGLINYGVGLTYRVYKDD